jgi:protein-S-isoprenylcysteine O-methyltransferase Ste14
MNIPAERERGSVEGTSAPGRQYARPVNAVRVRAWIGTIVFLFLEPGIVAGLIPWLITGWRLADPGAWAWPVRIVAGVLLLGGIAVLLDAFARFARADGTPAPPAPTAHLVVAGPYRFVRNPMYLAVLAIILGQALLFLSWWVLVYAAVTFLTVALFVKGYEEPTLEDGYGEEYRTYRANVRGWIPRLRPWTPD